MKKIKMKLMALAFIAGLSVIGGGMIARAEANTSTVTVSPMADEIILTPGETYEGAIKISNPAAAEQNLEYSISIGSYSQKPGENGGEDEFDIDSRSNYNQIMDWITVDNETGSVAPNDTDVVAYSIEVPETAPAGGQYATLIVRDETEREGKNGGNVSIGEDAQIASIIYAEVSGETIDEGKIVENSIPAFSLSDELVANSMVENNGNIHTRASYSFQVWPMGSDEEICTNEENPTTEFMMPETSRYHTETCKVSSPGIYRIKQVVKIFGEESVVEATVIYCPIWLMFIVVFIIVAMIVWIVMQVRGRNKSSRSSDK